jgi:hypothetical protein
LVRRTSTLRIGHLLNSSFMGKEYVILRLVSVTPADISAGFYEGETLVGTISSKDNWHVERDGNICVFAKDACELVNYKARLVRFDVYHLTAKDVKAGFTEGQSLDGIQRAPSVFEVTYGGGKKHFFYYHQCFNVQELIPTTVKDSHEPEGKVPLETPEKKSFKTTFGVELVEGDLVTFQIQDLTEEHKRQGFYSGQILDGALIGGCFTASYNGRMYTFTGEQCHTILKRTAVKPDEKRVKELRGVLLKIIDMEDFFGKPCAFEDLMDDKYKLKPAFPESVGGIQLDTKKVMDAVKEGSPSVTQDDYDRQLVLDVLNRLIPTFNIDLEVVEEFLRERTYKRNRISILKQEIQERTTELDKLRGSGK